MRTKALLICLALSIAATAETTRACSCSGQNLNDREKIEREFAEAAVVFEGEVAPGGREVAAPTVNKPGLGMIVFRVIRAFKGVHDESIQLYDSMAGTDCGGWDQEKPGKKYFVYGFQGTDGKTYIQACTRTGPLESAGPDLRYALGEPATEEDLRPPGEKWRLLGDPTLAKRGATVEGSVRRSDKESANGVFITLWDVDQTGHPGISIGASQKVNPDGAFTIRFLAPGKYWVTAEDSHVTQTTRFVAEYGTIALDEGKTLSALDVLLHPESLGCVSVRVIAPPELHDRIFVELRDPRMDSAVSAPFAYSKTADLDAKNVALFESVPFGKYDVFVHLGGDDISKPSWTHDNVQVQLNGNHAEVAVHLHENQK